MKGFDEYMNIVLDSASEVNIKMKTRKNLGFVYVLEFSGRSYSSQGRQCYTYSGAQLTYHLCILELFLCLLVLRTWSQRIL